MGRMPAGWAGTLSIGGIQIDSIAILPVLHIPPFPRPYRCGAYPNPTYPIVEHVALNPTEYPNPIYPSMSSFLQVRDLS